MLGEGTQRAQPSLLGVTQLDAGSSFAPRFCRSAVGLLASHAAFHFLINAYSGEPSSLSCFRHRRIRTAQIVGSKALLWKLLVTPEATRSFDYVWLVDGDMDFGHERFQISHVLSVLRATGAPLLQPTVLPMEEGGRATDHQRLRPRPNSCLVRTTAFVEVQTPFFRGDAWRRFHEDVLMRIPDELLRACDWVDFVMCAHAELVSRGSCLITQGANVVHLRTRGDFWQQNRTSASGVRPSFCPRFLFFLWHTFPAARQPGRAWSVETTPPPQGPAVNNKSVPWYRRPPPRWFIDAKNGIGGVHEAWTTGLDTGVWEPGKVLAHRTETSECVRKSVWGG